MMRSYVILAIEEPRKWEEKYKLETNDIVKEIDRWSYVLSAMDYLINGPWTLLYITQKDR